MKTMYDRKAPMLLIDHLENAINHYKIENKLSPWDEEQKQGKLTFEENRHGKFKPD